MEVFTTILVDCLRHLHASAQILLPIKLTPHVMRDNTGSRLCLPLVCLCKPGYRRKEYPSTPLSRLYIRFGLAGTPELPAFSHL